MKQILFLSLLFLSTLFCETIESLRSTYRIEDQILTTSSGHIFERYPFRDELHFELAYRLKDPALADQIHNAYSQHLLPSLSHTEDGLSMIAKVLDEICHYFGSPAFTPLEAMNAALRFYGLEAWSQTHQSAIAAFIKEANCPLYPFIPNNINNLFTVAIISTTCSGGNHSAALSIANLLNAQPNTRAVVIDVEEIAQKHDPVMVATGKYSYDMIYSHILQKRNDLSVIKERKILCREIQRYIPNHLLQILKTQIALLRPDWIISTRSYTCDDMSLATLGVPFRLFHPDYELCSSLCSYYRHIPSTDIRFWVPIVQPTVFRPLFENLHSEPLLDMQDDSLTLFDKLSQIMHRSSAQLALNFEEIGFPCSHFFEIADKEAIKKKWGIQPDEIPIFIVMGKHGTSTMRSIFNELNHAKTDHLLKYFFICGKDSNLQEELKKLASHSMTICGLLSSEDMNEIMNVATLGISKGGGATIQEAIATQTPLLITGCFPWEESNVAYLESLGLGTKLDPNTSLIKQIEQCIQSTRKRSTAKQEWKQKLLSKMFFDTTGSNLNHPNPD